MARQAEPLVDDIRALAEDLKVLQHLFAAIEKQSATPSKRSTAKKTGCCLSQTFHHAKQKLESLDRGLQSLEERIAPESGHHQQARKAQSAEQEHAQAPAQQEQARAQPAEQEHTRAPAQQEQARAQPAEQEHTRAPAQEQARAEQEHTRAPAQQEQARAQPAEQEHTRAPAQQEQARAQPAEQEHTRAPAQQEAQPAEQEHTRAPAQQEQARAQPAEQAQAQQERLGAPVYKCSYQNFFDHDEELFAKICSDVRAQEFGYVKFELSGLPPLQVESTSIMQPDSSHAAYFNYAVDGNSVRVSPSPRKGPITYPTLPPPPVQESSRSVLKQLVEEIIRSPPKTGTYVIGNPVLEVPELHAGERITQRPDMQGINTPYIYLSLSHQTLTILHREDANTGSKNVVVAGGGKILITIKPSSAERFESMMCDAFTNSWSCSQRIRHMNRLVTPSQLDEWGVKYDISLLSVGQGFATLPGAVYHMVVNTSLNLALAVNWESPNAPAFPAGYKTCGRSCPEEFAIKQHEYSMSKSAKWKRRPAEFAESLSKRRRTSSSLAESRVNALAESLVNASRIRKFFELAPSQPPSAGKKGSLTWDQEAAHCYTLSKKFSESAKHQNLQSWIWLLRLVDIIDEHNAKESKKKTPSSVYNGILKELDVKETKKNREKFILYLKRPRLWKKILGNYRGLLPFIAFDDQGWENPCFQNFDVSTDLKAFHDSLARRDIEEMVQTGDLLMKCLQEGVKLPEMLWETIKKCDLQDMSLKRLKTLLPLQLRTKNTIDPGWKKPTGWPEEIAGPDSFWPGQTCDLCSKLDCECIWTCFPEPPSVVDYQDKGLGLRANMAYKKNDLIGEIVGCFMLRSIRDGYCLEFVRSDLEPIVIQLYTGRESNIFRFVNHSCRKASASCRGMGISGAYRMVICAKRDIRKGEEITMDCGKGFLGSKKCLCESCNSTRMPSSSHA